MKRMLLIIVSIAQGLFIPTAASDPVQAQPAVLDSAVATNALESFGDAVMDAPLLSITPFNPQAHLQKIQVDVQLSCYATNLRSVKHPMDTCGTLHMDVDIEGLSKVFTLNIPALVVMKNKGGNQCANKEEIKVTSQSKELIGAPEVDVASGLVRAEVQWTSSSFLTVKKNGDYLPSTIPTKVRSIGLRQTLSKNDIPTKAGQAHNGLVTNAIKYQIAPDGGRITIEASLPGEIGSCGGYISPLMVFFDTKRPSFTGSSEFPLYPGAKTNWVEHDAPGYFLALDRNRDGKIDDPRELFGNSLNANGFLELRKLDTNRDGMLSIKDREFSKLLLWRDQNGDGISQKHELTRLGAHQIEAISLDYSSHTARVYGDRARITETASFAYRAPSGELKKGEVADVWFARSPVLLSELQ